VLSPLPTEIDADAPLENGVKSSYRALGLSFALMGLGKALLKNKAIDCWLLIFKPLDLL
jgi:hypothetical protein